MAAWWRQANGEIMVSPASRITPCFRSFVGQPKTHYRIEKHPKLRLKQGQYSVIGLNGQVLKRGHDLKAVLRVLERKLIRAVSD